MRSHQFSDEEVNSIIDKIDRLLTKGIIKETSHEEKYIYFSNCHVSYKQRGNQINT